MYTGSASGVYTAPDRVRNFSLQYFSNNEWKDIPGFAEKGNKYAQVFKIFESPVTTNKIRFISNDTGVIKVREIKLFAKGGPENAKSSYDVGGIQRTGEVVRLFAKGFKDERPLYQTISSVKDDNLDALTSFDEKSGNYYVWLVQRGQYNNRLSIDLSALNISSGSPVTAETVSPNYFGEVTSFMYLPVDKKFNLMLAPQSVVLLTIPKALHGSYRINAASAVATVSGGKNAAINYGTQQHLTVSLNASQPENNKVSYIYFDVPNVTSTAQKIILTVNGKVDKDNSLYRLHVYGIPSEKWDQQKLNWNNTLLLDSKEALIKEVGQKAFFAGEIAFKNKQEEHKLDVTDLVKKHAGKGITFVLVRETRQLGDDEDKGREVMINSAKGRYQPTLEFWFSK